MVQQPRQPNRSTSTPNKHLTRELTGRLVSINGCFSKSRNIDQTTGAGETTKCTPSQNKSHRNCGSILRHILESLKQPNTWFATPEDNVMFNSGKDDYDYVQYKSRNFNLSILSNNFGFSNPHVSAIRPLRRTVEKVRQSDVFHCLAFI